MLTYKLENIIETIENVLERHLPHFGINVGDVMDRLDTLIRRRDDWGWDITLSDVVNNAEYALLRFSPEDHPVDLVMQDLEKLEIQLGGFAKLI